MLRNRDGWARRWSIAIVCLGTMPLATASLVLLATPALRAATLVTVQPLQPVNGSSTTPSTFQAPTDYSLLGYVYVDSAHLGMKLPGEWGVSGVTIALAEYSPSDPNTVINSFTTTTGSTGCYHFTNLQPGDLYTIQEMQPLNFTSTVNNVGYFLGASGGTLSAPLGIGSVASNGTQDPAFPDELYDIVLPAPTGAFAPNGSGVYSAAGYNFGELPITPVSSGTVAAGRALTLSVPGGGSALPNGSLSSVMTVAGGNNRFLAGPGAGVLSLTATVQNSASLGASAINWQISSMSGGLSFSPTSGTNLAAQSSSVLTGTLDGSGLSPGSQNLMLSFNGQTPGSGTNIATSTASAAVDPVNSRGIDSVTTASFGRVMQGSIASSSFTVTSAGSHDTNSDLTMNAGSVSGTGVAGSFTATNGSPVLFNGTTTTSPAVAISATFSNTATGPVSDSLTLPGDAGLFTGETLASGTPVLPSLVVPYTATVIESRGIDSVTSASFGRVMQGSIASSSFTVTSAGSHDTNSDLTMNAGSVTGTGAAGSFIATISSPVLFNGTTTTSPAVAVSATFSNSITGPVSDSLTLPGNAGLFTGETLAAGTPVLPSLVVPYTATVIEPRAGTGHGRRDLQPGQHSHDGRRLPARDGRLVADRLWRHQRQCQPRFRPHQHGQCGGANRKRGIVERRHHAGWQGDVRSSDFQ